MKRRAWSTKSTTRKSSSRCVDWYKKVRSLRAPKDQFRLNTATVERKEGAIDSSRLGASRGSASAKMVRATKFECSKVVLHKRSTLNPSLKYITEEMLLKRRTMSCTLVVQLIQNRLLDFCFGFRH